MVAGASASADEDLAVKKIQPVDRLVGRRVRMMRVSRRLSQTELGSKLGITFQQVQKYERGTNRVSASRLSDIARILGVEVAHFFADAGDREKLALIGKSDAPPRLDLLILHRLSELPEGHLKQQLVELIFTLAKKAPPDESPSEPTSANAERKSAADIA